MTLLEEIQSLLDRAEVQDSKLREHVIYNLGIFYTIQTSYRISDRLPLNLKMREDLWFRYDRLLFAAYYRNFLSKKFAPVEEMNEFAITLAQLLESANGGQIIVKEWAMAEPGWFRNQCERFASVPERLKEVFIPKVLSQNPIFADYEHPAEQFQEWLSEIAEDDKAEALNTGFQFRMKSLPFLMAKNSQELATETLRVFSWDTLFTSTNAYQQGGAAQSFAPYLGNDDTMRFLDAAREWKAGKTLLDHPLTSLGGSGDIRVNISGHSAVTELYGFLNMQRAPFLNRTSLDKYKQLLGLQIDALRSDEIGMKIRQTLEGNSELCARMAKTFDGLKERVEAPKTRLREMQSFKGKRIRELFDERQCLVHGMDAEFESTFGTLDLNWNNVEKAIALTHLMLDSRFFLEQEGKNQVSVDQQKSVPEDLKTASEEQDGARHLRRRLEDSQLLAERNLSRIFYGPPGTGKTYHCFSEAVRIIDGARCPVDREDIMRRFFELRSQGRIEFVTFHQSYSYEDFVEGLRPETDQNQQLRYFVRPGVLKSFVNNVNSRGLSAAHPLVSNNSTVWRVSLGSSSHREYSFETESVGFNYDVPDDLRDLDIETYFSAREKKIGMAILESFRDELKIGDIVCVFMDANSIQAVGVVTGNYYFQKQSEGFVHRRQVQWLDRNPRVIADLNDGKRMSTPALHRLSRVSVDQLFERIGLLHSNRTETDPSVIIIDEINRGNLSKIFGEIITILEPDKRKGMRSEIEITLPYSGDRFALPHNLYLLGTMNTADRSIALMDFAMRRRFQFTYLSPNPKLVEETVDGIYLRRFFQRLNLEIRTSLGRDYELGHAMFMNIETKEDLFQALRNQIVPLLREYFYDDERRLKEIIPWSFEPGWMNYESGEAAEPKIDLN
jgi:5-methylcytosine-specific restriction protein B